MSPPEQIVVVVGASNVTLALPHIAAYVAGASGDRRTDLYVAHGPGRSYGENHGVLGCRFIGHARSELLTAVEQAARETRAPVMALLTDVGNDIPYGVGAPRILEWVESVARRLETLGAGIGLTALPLESVARLSPRKFAWLRRVYFPTCSAPRDRVLEDMRELGAGLERSGRKTPPDPLAPDSGDRLRLRRISPTPKRSPRTVLGMASHDGRRRVEPFPRRAGRPTPRGVATALPPSSRVRALRAGPKRAAEGSSGLGGDETLRLLNRYRGEADRPRASIGTPPFSYRSTRLGPAERRNASAPPTTGRSIEVPSRSTVSSAPGAGRSVKSRSLEKIIKPML